jgi:hypothetical protein
MVARVILRLVVTTNANALQFIPVINVKLALPQCNHTQPGWSIHVTTIHVNMVAHAHHLRVVTIAHAHRITWVSTVNKQCLQRKDIPPLKMHVHSVPAKMVAHATTLVVHTNVAAPQVTVVINVR